MTPTAATPPAAARAMRADARRNREAVILAARRVMANKGLEAQMDEIAREAGVGVGTVYRHFPTKDDLIAALADYRFQRLAQFANDALEEEDAGAAFDRYLTRAAELQAEDRALSEVMRDRPEAMQEAARRVGLLELTRSVMTRAQEAGAVRADAEPEDVPMMMSGLATSTPGCAGPFITASTWRRYLAITLDGLRAGGRTEMPPR